MAVLLTMLDCMLEGFMVRLWVLKRERDFHGLTPGISTGHCSGQSEVVSVEISMRVVSVETFRSSSRPIGCR